MGVETAAGWFDPEEWHHGNGLESYLIKLGTLIQELGRPVPDLQKVKSRSKAMAACYPGALAARRSWLRRGRTTPGAHGELAIFRKDDPSVLRRRVAPLQNRLLLFWSDRRTPHEVLPSEVPRYSLTVWLLDNTKKAVGTVSYTWEELPGGWSLQVQLLPSAPEQCPVLEISEAQVRITTAQAEPLLCVPVPEQCAAPVPKWSRKKRLLSMTFEGVAAVPSSAASSFAEQIAQRGWGTVDGFLPGPAADELRRFVLEQKAAGNLRYGKNKHEGPVSVEGDTKSPMKNDEYTFLEADPPPAVRELTQRCNRLLAKLLVTDRLKQLQGKNLWQVLEDGIGRMKLQKG
eukprot:Skav225399  [mRNA]  locus=scaffold2656:348679:354979:+ [translate_table: standard]